MGGGEKGICYGDYQDIIVEQLTVSVCSVRSNGGLSPADLVEDIVLITLPLSHSHKCSLFFMLEIVKKKQPQILILRSCKQKAFLISDRKGQCVGCSGL